MTHSNSDFPIESLAAHLPIKVDMSADPRARLRDAATQLFAQRGYGKTSIREICAHAQTSSNMVHHYFGSKEGLFREILAELSDQVFTVPLRIIQTPATSLQEFQLRTKIFLSETLEALISHEHVYRLASKELMVLPAFQSYRQGCKVFFDAAQGDGIIRDAVNTDMIPGLILDRLGNQVVYSPIVKRQTDNDIVNDPLYRANWLDANFELIIGGLL